MQLVSDEMTRQVRSVPPQDSLRDAARMMDELIAGAPPVCNGEPLAGMATDRGITVRATSAGLAPAGTMVDQVMSADARSCHEDQSLDEVIRQMADTQIRRAPVVSRDDPSRLVGIVSLSDIAPRQEGGAQAPQVGQVVEKVSFPSEPDVSPQGKTTRPEGTAAGATTSSNGSGTGTAGSDIVDDRLKPRYEASATAGRATSSKSRRPARSTAMPLAALNCATLPAPPARIRRPSSPVGPVAMMSAAWMLPEQPARPAALRQQQARPGPASAPSPEQP